MSRKLFSARWIALLLAGSVPFAVFASIPRVTAPTPADTSVKIRVRVAPGLATVHLRGFDLRIFDEARENNSAATAKLASAPDRVSEWEIHCGKGHVLAKRVGKVPSA